MARMLLNAAGNFETIARRRASFLRTTAHQDAMWQIDREQTRGFEETSNAGKANMAILTSCEVLCLPCRLTRTIELGEPRPREPP
jgi:hypothetical protein